MEGHQKAVARTLQKIHDAGYWEELTAVSGMLSRKLPDRLSGLEGSIRPRRQDGRF